MRRYWTSLTTQYQQYPMLAHCLNDKEIFSYNIPSAFSHTNSSTEILVRNNIILPISWTMNIHSQKLHVPIIVCKLHASTGLLMVVLKSDIPWESWNFLSFTEKIKTNQLILCADFNAHWGDDDEKLNP